MNYAYALRSNNEDVLNNSVEDLHIHITSEEEVQAFLSTTDSEDVKLLVPLGATTGSVQSPDEQELVAILSRLESERASGRSSPVPDSAIDSLPIVDGSLTIGGDETTSAEAEVGSAEVEAHSLRLPHVAPLPPALILVGASIAALLALACVTAGLYIAALVRASVFRSETAWRILPRLEAGALRQSSGNQARVSSADRKALLEDELNLALPPLLRKLSSRTSLRNSNSRSNLNADSEKPAIVLNDDNEEDPEYDEKFYDFDSADPPEESAFGSPLTYATPTAALSPVIGTAELPLLAAAAIAAAFASANMNASVSPEPEMREIPSSSSAFAAQPTPRWASTTDSATSSPLLSSTSMPLPGSLPVSNDTAHTHQYVAAHPNPNHLPAPALPALMLALQLRSLPGMMDGAWLVHLVVTVFGWLGVLVGGSGAAGTQPPAQSRVRTPIGPAMSR